MFDVEELFPCLSHDWFTKGHQILERGLLEARLGIPSQLSEDQFEERKLSRFCQAVLGSVFLWANPREGRARDVCLAAADVETGLGTFERQQGRLKSAHEHIFKAALLYDLGGMPGTAATVAARNGLDERLKDFFARSLSSVWGTLTASAEELSERTGKDGTIDIPSGTDQLLESALGEAILEDGRLFQEGDVGSKSVPEALLALQNGAGSFSLTFTSDDVAALRKSLQLRRENGTLGLLHQYSNLDEALSRIIHMPTELWPVQRRALESGLLLPHTISYGLAAPTGTGKTSLTRALIASTLKANPTRKIVYVSPSRALVHQVARDLSMALTPAGFVVKELGAHLTVHEQIAMMPNEADVLVFTPERADLLMRVESDFVKSIALVIVDEAHHIEQGSRGILLEFYLWRLRVLVPPDARIVQLSAVTPNMGELVSWLDNKSSSAEVTFDWRANRLRVGVFERRKEGTGIVQFEGSAPFTLFGPSEFPVDKTKGLALLAHKLSKTGIVLVLSTTVKGAERVAEEVAALRTDATVDTDNISERLDARIERELYPEAPLRALIRRRVAYHHAQLPPSIRVALEDAISARKIDVVCATTTLGEGVNFPFSTVLVESLVGRDYQISPRALWNIAGRAGRFGVDSEGHCIIFEPKAFVSKLTTYKLDDYLRTKLNDIPPVRSALATALTDLKSAIDDSQVSFSDLSAIQLNKIALDGKANSTQSRRIRGLVNLLRVGYAHANASKIISLDDAEAVELSSGLLASRQIQEHVRAFAKQLGLQQRKVIKDAFSNKTELLEIASRIGWALETQAELYEWLKARADWQLESFGKIVLGGRVIIPENLGYVLGPVCKLMAEFEGEKLGGFTAFIATSWIEGLPLTTIDARQTKKDLGRLVRVIYARVQYLLPWALYGVHELLQYEAKRRKIHVQDGVHDLSVLAAEGVPSFDALQLLMNLGMERVDATRIATAYRQGGPPQTDIFGFFRGLEWGTLVGIVRGSDARRLDPDMRPMWERIRNFQAKNENA